jgi:hypothetical protein
VLLIVRVWPLLDLPVKPKMHMLMHISAGSAATPQRRTLSAPQRAIRCLRRRARAREDFMVRVSDHDGDVA